MEGKPWTCTDYEGLALLMTWGPIWWDKHPHHPHYKRHMANVEVILQSDQSFMLLVGQVETGQRSLQDACEFVVSEWTKKTEGNMDRATRGALARFRAWGRDPSAEAIARMIEPMVENWRLERGGRRLV